MAITANLVFLVRNPIADKASAILVLLALCRMQACIALPARSDFNRPTRRMELPVSLVHWVKFLQVVLCVFLVELGSNPMTLILPALPVPVEKCLPEIMTIVRHACPEQNPMTKMHSVYLVR